MSTAVLVAMVAAAVVAFTALQILAWSRQRRSAGPGGPHQVPGWTAPPAGNGGGLLFGAAKPLGRPGAIGRCVAAIRGRRRAAGRRRDPDGPRGAGQRLPRSAQRA